MTARTGGVENAGQKSESNARTPVVTVYPKTSLPDDIQLGAYVIIGVPPRGTSPGDLETVIGPGAHIRSHTVIYAGNVIGAGFQTGHSVMVREENQIGNEVSVGTHSIIEHHVRIDDGVRIHSGAFIPEYSVLGEGSWVGPGAVFTNATYPLGANVKEQLEGPHLLPGAKVGANATLLPGVRIGRDALVGAGATVTKDVADGQVVVGNPARVVGTVAEIPAYRQDALVRKVEDQTEERRKE